MAVGPSLATVDTILREHEAGGSNRLSPTDHAAECAVRKPVLWRRSLRFAGRTLTATIRHRAENVFDLPQHSHRRRHVQPIASGAGRTDNRPLSRCRVNVCTGTRRWVFIVAPVTTKAIRAATGVGSPAQ